MIAVALIVVSVMVVLVLQRTHRSLGIARRHVLRVRDAMCPEPLSAVSAEATVEEVLDERLGAAVHDMYAVIDHDGRAVGALRRDDLVRLPHAERPARLVADVMHAGVVAGGDPLDRVLARPPLGEADTMVVIDDERLPIGTLTLRDARARAVRAQVDDGPRAQLGAPAEGP